MSGNESAITDGGRRKVSPSYLVKVGCMISAMTSKAFTSLSRVALAGVGDKSPGLSAFYANFYCFGPHIPFLHISSYVLGSGMLF